MKTHQTIIGFVAVVLLAAAATATAATMRSPAPSTHLPIAPVGVMSFKELAVDVNKLPIEDFDDMSLVYSTMIKALSQKPPTSQHLHLKRNVSMSFVGTQRPIN